MTLLFSSLGYDATPAPSPFFFSKAGLLATPLCLLHAYNIRVRGTANAQSVGWAVRTQRLLLLPLLLLHKLSFFFGVKVREEEEGTEN